MRIHTIAMAIEHTCKTNLDYHLKYGCFQVVQLRMGNENKFL